MATRVLPQQEEELPPKGGGLYFGKQSESVKFIKSGSKLLDLALGGGWARGRISNVVGDKAVGKTLICIEAAANFVIQEPKAKIRYREAESAFDELYAEALGFPLSKVDFGEPIETIEDLFEDLSKVVEAAKVPELYIVDSLDALSDRSEMERGIDEGSYGTGKAKQMSQLFRRLVRKLAEKDVTLMIISQVRDNIGVTFGRKTTRSGGRALDFYASQIIFLSQIEKLSKTISNVKRITGIEIKAMVDKNKIGMPFRDAQFPIMFGYGIDDQRACLNWIKQVALKVPEGTKLETMGDIHKIVEDEWWRIEQGFLPKQQKYR